MPWKVRARYRMIYHDSCDRKKEGVPSFVFLLSSVTHQSVGAFVFLCVCVCMQLLFFPSLRLDSDFLREVGACDDSVFSLGHPGS